MKNEEIRQKAIECGKAFEEMCKSKERETDEEFNTICYCEYNEIAGFTSCAAVYGYEHGFADGVIEALKPYDVESVEDLVRNVRNKTIEDAREAIIKMKKTCDSNGHDCDRCEYTYHSYHQSCADYVLEKMKEGAENG